MKSTNGTLCKEVKGLVTQFNTDLTEIIVNDNVYQDIINHSGECMMSTSTTSIFLATCFSEPPT